MIYVLMYLIAIVAANITVSIYGPSVTIINAFLFIGLNLTARDTLHDLWSDNLKRNMSLLIIAGSLLSWAMGAGQIALASGLAFAASETVDSIAYHMLKGKYKLVQINGSNVFSAAVDSLIFPVLAFGFPVLWLIVAGQFAAKVLGGFVWSVIINRNELKMEVSR